MSLIRNALISSCAAGLLSACSGTLMQAERADVPTDPFARALHAGYTGLARAEMNENDFADADAFAARAVAAAAGNPPKPENFAHRRLPAEKLPELSAARNKLVTALARGAANSAPEQAARAQLAFECWMQEQEENFQTTEIADCRDRFTAAIAGLDTKPIANADPAQPRATPASLRTALKPRGATPLTTRFVVYFDLDAATVVPGAESEITRAAEAARRSGAAMVRVTGHADRSGSDGHNMKLSRTRAQEVVRALRRLGLPDIGIATQAYGEEKPAVPTGDGRPEPRNRRVEIELTH